MGQVSYLIVVRPDIDLSINQRNRWIRQPPAKSRVSDQRTALSTRPAPNQSQVQTVPFAGLRPEGQTYFYDQKCRISFFRWTGEIFPRSSRARDCIRSTTAVTSPSMRLPMVQFIARCAPFSPRFDYQLGACLKLIESNSSSSSFHIAFLVVQYDHQTSAVRRITSQNSFQAPFHSPDTTSALLFEPDVITATCELLWCNQIAFHEP